MNGRLFRSRDDRVIAGVAGGLADYLDLDPSLVRVLWVILALFSGGAFLLIYIVMALVVPEEPWQGFAPPPPPGTDAATGDAAAAGAGPTTPGAPAQGTPTSAWSSPADWRAQRSAWRAQRRAERAAFARTATAWLRHTCLFVACQETLPLWPLDLRLLALVSRGPGPMA